MVVSQRQNKFGRHVVCSTGGSGELTLEELIEGARQEPNGWTNVNQNWDKKLVDWLYLVVDFKYVTICSLCLASFEIWMMNID